MVTELLRAWSRVGPLVTELPLATVGAVGVTAGLPFTREAEGAPFAFCEGEGAESGAAREAEVGFFCAAAAEAYEDAAVAEGSVAETLFLSAGDVIWEMTIRGGNARDRAREEALSRSSRDRGSARTQVRFRTIDDDFLSSRKGGRGKKARRQGASRRKADRWRLDDGMSLRL
jgi:hypothetical protein